MDNLLILHNIGNHFKNSCNEIPNLLPQYIKKKKDGKLQT